MKKLTKKATALACAMLMTVGGLSQASAAPVKIDDFHGAKMSGTASKSTTTVTATTTYNAGVSGAATFRITARAYGKPTGIKQYGEERYATGDSISGTVSGSVYFSSGFGTTGYGGDHSLRITILDSYGLSKSYETGVHTSNY